MTTITPGMPDAEALTVAQAAAYCNTSKAAINRLIRRGLLTEHWLGYPYPRILRAELDRIPIEELRSYPGRNAVRR